MDPSLLVSLGYFGHSYSKQFLHFPCILEIPYLFQVLAPLIRVTLRTFGSCQGGQIGGYRPYESAGHLCTVLLSILSAQ